MCLIVISSIDLIVSTDESSTQWTVQSRRGQLFCVPLLSTVYYLLSICYVCPFSHVRFTLWCALYELFSCSSFTLHCSILINFPIYHLQFVVCCSSFISFHFLRNVYNLLCLVTTLLIVVHYLKFSLTMDHDHCIATLYSGSTNIHNLLCNQCVWMSKFNIQFTGSWSLTNCLYIYVLWWCQ